MTISVRPPRGEPRRFQHVHHPDVGTKAGAEELADKIRAFWFKRGKFPNVNVVFARTTGLEGPNGLFCVRSDMLNGAPQ